MNDDTLTNEQAQQIYDESVATKLPVFGSLVLVKSTEDSFHYYIGLKNGATIAFTGSTLISGDWLHLDEAKFIKPDAITGSEWNMDLPGPDRGIDVRISEIAWAIDGGS